MAARSLTPNEVAALDLHLKSKGEFKTRALILVGVNSGYRISELLSLVMSQVLTREGFVATEVTIARSQLKGGRGARRRSVRSRRVVLNEAARGAITDYLASLSRVPQPSEFLFRSREGRNRPIHRSQAHRLIKNACIGCGIDPTRVACHSLRRSFCQATYLATGRCLVSVQRILQHSSPEVTARYLETPDLDDVVRNLSHTIPTPAQQLCEAHPR